MARTRWTAEQDALLRAKYKTVPSRVLAQELGLKKGAVYARAQRLGITEQNARRVSREEIKTRVLELYPLGWSDREIADLLQVDRHRVGEVRIGMGLSSNALSRRQRDRVASATRKQLQATGFESLSKYRLAIWEAWKTSLGWPAGLSLRAVQALEVFYRLQIPLTRVQLCHAMGVSSAKKTAPISNKKGGTVLAELAAAGFIGRLPKAFENKALYFMNPGVKPSDSRTEPTFPNSDGPICDSAGVVVSIPSRSSNVAANATRRIGKLDHGGRHPADCCQAAGEGQEG